MKQILVLGAGLSAPYLISYLLKHAQEHNWFVVVGDIAPEQAEKHVGDHPCGDTIYFDINDESIRSTQIERADIVINMLPPQYQYEIVLDCIHHGKHMISTSYQNSRVEALDADAHRKGIVILNEMGLDPGIDHMMVMKVLSDVRDRNGLVTAFFSYGGSLPAPDFQINPVQYCTTWNPRNVVMSGEHGAQYMENGKIKLLPHYEVFQNTWPVEVEGVGTFEAYANRNSLIYKSLFELEHVRSMVRGTLRYPGWSETWLQIVRLGWPNESLQVPNLGEYTYAEITEMFLPEQISDPDLELSVARFLEISPTGKIMDNLRWLGIFSDEKVGIDVTTTAEALKHLLTKKLILPSHARDMVVLLHKVEAVYPEENNRKELILSSFVEYGEAGGTTAIAKSVGLPAAVAAKLILTGELTVTGCRIPVYPAIYIPVMKEIEALGHEFKETIIPIES